MDRKKLLKHTAFLIIAIFLLNYLANSFYWYSSILYFDMFMHFLGGFWLALIYIYLFNTKKATSLTFAKMALWVLVIGLLWEFFELYFVNYVADNPFDLSDTLSDLFFDLFGGSLAFLYCIKRIMLSKESGVQLK
jgi:hypothetical protein